MKNPEVSVIMSVYNGAEHLRESVESVLTQEEVDFEFIIVDDGSTDDSGAIIDEYAERDNRFKVVHQKNTGLTKALIKGCAEASGEFIARQDAGDMALPGKLEKLLACVRKHPEAAIVSCGTRFVGPHGEYLFEANMDPAKAQSCLLTLDLTEVRGACHSSVIFRRSLYENVGGYRAEFYFAQDLDLWIRMAEHGDHVVIPEVLHQTQFTPDSISGSHRSRQIKLAEIILESARLRRAGMSDQLALKKAKMISPRSTMSIRRLEKAKALYFIGACLRTQRDQEAKYYFREAFMTFPLHLKSAVRFLLG